MFGENVADIQDAEREQVEAIKKWWGENGRVVTIGIILGLGGVFGWKAWEARVVSNEEQASVLYEQLVNAAASNTTPEVDELAGTLMDSYPNSGYATLSALIRAGSAFQNDQTDEAIAYLQWVIDNAKHEEIKTIAKMRTARLLADQGKLDSALDKIRNIRTETLKAPLAELRGDLLVSEGKSQNAIEAYLEALANNSLSITMRHRLELKLKDLGADEPL